VEKTQKVISLSLMAIVFFASGYIAASMAWGPHGPQWKANVIVIIEKPNGNDVMIFKAVSIFNTITDIGERYIRNVIGNDNETNDATKYISLGNSTIAASKTKLDTEATTTGFIRTVATSIVGWVNAGDYAINYTKKFTATGNIAINAAGLQWSTTSNSDNNLYALASLGGTQSFQNNWNATIIWVITYNAN